MDTLLQNSFRKEFGKCGSFAQHKVCVISPEVVNSAIGSDEVHTHEQVEGDMVVTLPCAYHCGFSRSLNFGEAVNYATDKWLRSTPQAPNSQCILHNPFTPIIPAAKWRTLRSQLLL